MATIPPSPAAIVFVAYSEKQVAVGEAADLAAAVLALGRVRGVLDDRQRRAPRIGSRSAGWPYRWTGMIAFVRGVTSSATRSGSMFRSESRTSAKTGVAPVWTITFAVAGHVIGVVITSSPGPTPSATSARCIAAVPDETASACFAPDVLGEAPLELRRRAARSSASPSGSRLGDGGDLLVADRGRLEAEEGLAPLRGELLHGRSVLGLAAGRDRLSGKPAADELEDVDAVARARPRLQLAAVFAPTARRGPPLRAALPSRSTGRSRRLPRCRRSARSASRPSRSNPRQPRPNAAPS